MEKIRKMAKSLIESDLLIKGAIAAIGDKSKEQNSGFLNMYLGANLSGNLLSKRAKTWTRSNKSWGKTIKAIQTVLILPQPLLKWAQV